MPLNESLNPGKPRLEDWPGFWDLSKEAIAEFRRQQKLEKESGDDHGNQE